MKIETSLGRVTLTTINRLHSICHHCGKENIHLDKESSSRLEEELKFWKERAEYYLNIIAKGKIIE